MCVLQTSLVVSDPEAEVDRTPDTPEVQNDPDSKYHTDTGI